VHIRAMHPENRDYLCGICNYVSLDKLVLTKHRSKLSHGIL
jgi:hypothetical protein